MAARDPRPTRKWVTRHHLPGGARCTASTPGAVKTRTRTESYYYRPAGGRGERRPHVPLHTTDLATAWERMRVILRRERETGAGITTPLIEAAGLPLADHLAAWLEGVQDGRASPERLALLRRRVEELARLAGWKRAGDITRESCAKALVRLEREPGPPPATEGRSVQTRNHYLAHARQFSRWLHSSGRLAADPLADMRPVSVEGHERHRRRCPEAEEVRLLFDWLHSPRCPARQEMTGPHRAILYELCMVTGYRAGEARGLTRAHFAADWSEVRLSAREDKARRRRAGMPLPSWLAEKLRLWASVGGELFAAMPEHNPGRVLRQDLGAARKAWVKAGAVGAERTARAASPTLRYRVEGLDGPEFFDFHSLRHWHVTALASAPGIDPATLQALSRHSDPRLTLERYSHARASAGRRAVEGLPRPGVE